MKSKPTKKPLSPAPGSDAARAAGCLCPTMDNCHGKGYHMQPGVYVQRLDCPVHGAAARAAVAKLEEADK